MASAKLVVAMNQKYVSPFGDALKVGALWEEHALAYNYRSAFVHEYVDNKVATGGGLNPLSGVSEALNKWAGQGYEPYTIQYERSDDFHVTTYITFRKVI
ncbi:hypothetical protein [Frigoribacterium sp. UYMn621]|uniref:hypothetical protein n=1 Tax=Frigoribacterium sp. UYMn621 TaxID=3156343 RepID=UPI0033966BFF